MKKIITVEVKPVEGEIVVEGRRGFAQSRFWSIEKVFSSKLIRKLHVLLSHPVKLSEWPGPGIEPGKD